jgi:hypothetical protein
MVIDQAVSDVLDETIQALTLMDLNRLQAIEKRAVELAKSGVIMSRNRLNSISPKKNLLGLLQSCESNLDALNRLHGRNTRDQWSR